MDAKSFIDNYKTVVITRYFCFEGRAGRAEFWQFVLVNFIISAVLGLIPKAGLILQNIYALAVLLPGLGVTARRLHDRGKSGWFQLLHLIPLIGTLIVFLMLIPEGEAEDKVYGPAVK